MFQLFIATLTLLRHLKQHLQQSRKNPGSKSRFTLYLLMFYLSYFKSYKHKPATKRRSYLKHNNTLT